MPHHPIKQEGKKSNRLPHESEKSPKNKKLSSFPEKQKQIKKAIKKDKQPVQSKKIEIPSEVLKATPHILELEKDFSARRLELILKRCSPEVWFYSYENETSKEKVVLAKLLLQEKNWRIFTSLMVNHPEILRIIPLDAIKEHLQKQLNPKQQEDLKDLRELKKIARLSGSRPLLEIAMLENNIPLIRKLHRLGINLDAPNQTGSTPALIAAQNEYIDVLLVLKELGANLDTPINGGTTPACIAAQYDYLPMSWRYLES